MDPRRQNVRRILVTHVDTGIPHIRVVIPIRIAGGIARGVEEQYRTAVSTMWTNPLGSGGLFNNKGGGQNPLVVADNPAGRWNTFHIIQRDGDMTTIWLNGQLVVDHVKMENYWDYSKPLPAKGNIELQYHGDKLYWKNICARDLK